jgi:hypothetical protein
MVVFRIPWWELSFPTVGPRFKGGRAPFALSCESKLLELNLRMLRSQSLITRVLTRLQTKLRFRAGVSLPFFCLVAAFLAVLPPASAQDFTMTAAPFNPVAVDPGEDSASILALAPENGFTGSVTLGCAVTSDTAGVNLPACTVSPSSVKPSGGATATITTSSTVSTTPTTPGLYTVTITGTSPNTTVSLPLALSVLPVTSQFTITVATPVAPSSVPAGSGGEGTININPINGYTGSVTLSCSSVTPLVTLPPVCSFSPQPVPVDGTVATATITINTAGPVITGRAEHPRGFYALWLSLPMLTLAGFGAALGGRRSRKAWGLLGLFVISGSFLLMPACGNSNVTTTEPNGVTPPNTYSFTILGVDAAGNASSNSGTAGSGLSVSMGVTAPTN